MNAKTLLVSLMLLAISTPDQSSAQVKFLNARVRYDPDQILVLGCDLSIDGTYLVTGGDSIRIFHAASGDLLQQIRPVLRPRAREPGLIPMRHWGSLLRENRSTRQIKFSPIIKDVFATAGDDGIVRVWKVSEQRPLRVFKHHKGGISELAFSPNGKLLASGGSRHKRRDSLDEICVWDVASGRLLQSDYFYNDGVNGLTFIDDQTLVFAKNDDKQRSGSTIEFMDIDNWSSVRSIPVSPGGAHSVLLSPDRQNMVITGGECIPLGPDSCRPTGYLWLVDLKSGDTPQRVKTDPHGYFSDAVLLRSGDRFITATSVVDGAVTNYLEMRSSMDGSLLWATKCEAGHTFGLAILPDGRQIASCGHDRITFLDAGTGKETRSITVTR